MPRTLRKAKTRLDQRGAARYDYPNMGLKKIILRHALPLAALTILIVTVFGQVRHHEYIDFDEFQYIKNNEYVQSGLNIESLRWAFTTNLLSNWHPITWISLMLDAELFGSSPAAHHLMNVFWHWAASLMLYVLLWRMTHSMVPAVFVAALFAIHPLHVESVAWGAERKDTLSAFCGFAALVAYHGYIQGSPRRSWWYAGTAVFLALGLMSKSMLVTWPFVMLLLDYWPLNRWAGITGQWKADFRALVPLIVEKIPLFGLVAISSSVTFAVQSGSGAAESSYAMPFHIRLENAALTYVWYLLKTVWPSGLTVFYPHYWTDSERQLLLFYGLFSAVVLAVVTAAILYFGRRAKFLTVGWLWYLGTLIPVIGIVQVGMQSRADRYTYLPLVGIFIAIAWAIKAWTDSHRPHKTAVTVVAAMTTLVYALAAYVQVGYWKDHVTLFERNAELVRVNPVTEYQLGLGYLAAGRTSLAYSHFGNAADLSRDVVRMFYELDTTGTNSLTAEASDLARGQTYLRLGRIAEAEVILMRALEQSPNDASVHNALGGVSLMKGDRNQAVLHLRRALELDPNHEFAKRNLERLRTD